MSDLRGSSKGPKTNSFLLGYREHLGFPDLFDVTPEGWIDYITDQAPPSAERDLACKVLRKWTSVFEGGGRR